MSFASAAYVSGYVRKKLTGKDKPENAYLRYDEHGELHQVHPEFARMSLRPAIGLEWIKRYWRDVYPRDEVKVNGKTSRPPRYYDTVLTAPKPDDPTQPKYELDGITYPERLELMYDVKTKRIEEMEEIPPETLSSMKRAHERRLKLFSKRNKV